MFEKSQMAPFLHFWHYATYQKLRKKNFLIELLQKNQEVFSEIFLVSGKLHSAEKCKRGVLSDFLTSIVEIEEGPFGDIKNYSEKSLTKPKKLKG